MNSLPRKKDINSRDKFLDTIFEPDDECKDLSCSGCNVNEADIPQVDNAHPDQSVVQKKYNPRKMYTYQQPREYTMKR